ncbi:protein associated with UVRAG as autophagy enhancer isoform X2 [Ornithorhynchus anatinus]|uniref:protein associated with UVRAG as autophagy enhancer isoform X2 n=1 Tax=Ornithorhynchus anatinus TaxID=9258 RepID=UPI0010A8F242|nr:protein associated with UVRAG as autophagy enhancer isoform X2 [Ornithorhynchus anatinus]
MKVFPNLSSLQSLSLTSYSTARKQPRSQQLASSGSRKQALGKTVPSSRAAFHSSARISCLAQAPQISVLAGEFSRPAGIRHAGSSRFLPRGSAAATRQMLLSVLNLSGWKPSLAPGKMVLPATVQQESSAARWDGSSSGGLGDSDGNNGLPPEQPQSLRPPSPSDVRLTRHKAAWLTPQSAPEEQSPTPPLGSGEVPSPMDCMLPIGASPSLLMDAVPLGSTAASVASSLPPSSEKESGDFLLTPAARGDVFPRSSRGSSVTTELVVFGSSAIPGSTPHPAHRKALQQTSHVETATDKGAIPVNRRAISLSCSSPEKSMLPVDVEMENIHFFVADMIISAMERMKFNILNQHQAEMWSREESYQVDSQISSLKQAVTSSTSSDSGFEGSTSPQTERSPSLRVKEDHDIEEFVNLELGQFDTITNAYRCFQGSGKRPLGELAKRRSLEPDYSSAELTAKELYRSFRSRWRMIEVDFQLASSLNAAGPIIVNEDKLQKDFESSLDVVEEIKFKCQLRGTEDWVPPRFQVLFNLHPPLKRNCIVAAQNFFCAGCGTPIEPKYVKKLRYCDYLGKYFCNSCHCDSESCIPARILMKWDFKKYYVSNFSKHLLDSIWQQPVFNLLDISNNLYSKAKELDRVREIQEQLIHIKKLLLTCRFAESVLKEFEKVPEHLTNALHVFSLDDLVKTKRGLLAPILRGILRAGLAHVDSCQLCQGKGFICEFCRSPVVIFPFQTAACKRCSDLTQ